MAYERERRKMLEAAPDYISTLIGADYFHCEIRDKVDSDNPPNIAWTYYDKKSKRWVVCFRPEASSLSFSAKQALWRHEIGHIAFAHFGKATCTPEDPIRSLHEQLQVGDIQVNTYLLDDISALDEIGTMAKKLSAKFDAEAGKEIKEDNDSSGYLDPRVILPAIGLAVQEYSYDVIHAYLHQKIDEEFAKKEQDGSSSGNWTIDALASDLCGGIQNAQELTGEHGAELSAALLGAISDRWGKEPSIGNIRLRDHTLPDWVSSLETFARSIVEVVMADTRSHTRPQEIYAAYNVHMPTMRPRWAHKADQVCFLVDTSGSMFDELKYVMPVVQYLTQHKISVRLIAGDTRVTFDELLEPGKPLPEAITGGGGTEITPLFERAKEYNPRSIVCFTDGQVPRWPKDKDIPTLWVGLQTEAPYGTKA